MRKTIKYFEERLKNYKESLQKVNKRIRFIRKEVKNNKNLTENRKEILNNSYGKLLKLKERLEKRIIECTAEYNIKWKNRNKRTEKKVKTFDDLQLINEEYIFKSLKERLLESINLSNNIEKIPYSGQIYYIKDIDPERYDSDRKHYIYVYDNEQNAINDNQPITGFAYTVNYNPLNIEIVSSKGQLATQSFVNLLRNNYLNPKYEKIIKNQNK